MAEEEKTKKKRKKQTGEATEEEISDLHESGESELNTVIDIVEIAPLVVNEPKESVAQELYDEFFDKLGSHKFSGVLQRAQTIDVDIDSFDNVTVHMPGFGSHIVQKYLTGELGDKFKFIQLDNIRVAVLKKE